MNVLSKPLKLGAVTLPNRIILAPMAGISDRPFRRICHRLGCGLEYTEMVSAEALRRRVPKTLTMLPRRENEDYPVNVQLFGFSPEALAQAAVIAVSKGAQLLDVNMGCPVKKVVGGGAGSALLKDPALAVAIVAAIVAAVAVPVTVKVRTGWDVYDNDGYLDFARQMEQAGAAAIAVHPRTRSQFFSGQADWRKIAEIKQAVSIPVIGNGDIASAADAERMVVETGCDAVMIGRAACGRPWLFRQVLELAQGAPIFTPELPYINQAVRTHVELLVDEYGAEVAVRLLRKHVGWYSHGLSGSVGFRQAINQMHTIAAVLELADDFFNNTCFASGAVADAKIDYMCK